MKKLDYILFLFISFVFIFSCNTEAKFGFRKKVKVSEHKTAQTIIKSHVTKPEIKADNIDTCEIITASIADEKINSSEIQQHNSSVIPSISIKKINANSTTQNKKTVNPVTEKKLNILSILGFFIGIIGALFTLAFSTKFIWLLLAILTSLILCFIGLNQVITKPERYYGKGFAIAGIIWTALWIILFII